MLGSVGGSLGKWGLDVNARELILDDDQDTSITASTDDQIDFKIGGSDLVVMAAAQTTFTQNVLFANAAGPALVNEAATTTNPTLIPNQAELDTGIGWASDVLHFVLGGATVGSITTTSFLTANAAGPALANEVATTTNPTLIPNQAEMDTGIGWVSDTLHIVLGGANEIAISTASLSPGISDGSALGTTSLMWSDLFLASASVINFNAGDVTLTHAADKLTFAGGDFYIEDGKGMVIGHTAQITGDNRAELQVVGVSDPCSSMMLGRWSADASNAILQFVKSRNGSTGSNTIVADNDAVGSIRWMPDDGVDFATRAAIFVAEVDDGSPEAGGVGMAFVWQQMAGGGTSAARETMRLAADGTLSLAVGDLDLNNNDLLNVGAAGQDWTDGYLAHVGAGSGGEQKIRIDNSSTGEAIIQLWSSDGGGDAYLEIGAQGTYIWRVGQDNSASDLFAIGGNDGLGANDALRITATSPPVISFHTTQGSDFDYACASCGRHGLTSFTCCGLVEWHDDVQDFRSMSRREESAMDYMERVGVIQRSTKPSGEPEIFTTFQMVYFVGSMAYQNRERMDTQYEELNRRLQAIGA